MTQTIPTEPDIRRAQYEAFKLTKEYGIGRPEEIRLPDIAMDLGIYVHEESLVGAEARLIRNGKKGIIRINASIPQLGRKRFAIAHELGHWKLHDSILQVCSEQDLLGTSFKPIETEANAFAAVFLMPTQLFSPLCEGERPSLELICELSEKFNTTITATAFRFVDECRYPCAVVFSENRKISWWKSRKGNGFWMERGWEISEESSAWEPLEKEPRRKVNPQLWFFDQFKNSGIKLYEQSMPLGRYGMVLTLLSIEDALSDDEGDSEWSRARISHRIHTI